MIDTIKQTLQNLREYGEVSEYSYRKGNALYINGQVQLLSQSKDRFEFLVDDEYDDFEIAVIAEDDNVYADAARNTEPQDEHFIAAMLTLIDELGRLHRPSLPEGKAYTREGMMRRVLDERKQKADKAEYRIQFSSNPYGEHLLMNEKAVKYKITFRDVEKETGYCSCMDYRTNKLGTCKHLLFAYQKKKGDKKSLRKPKKRYPFVEIFLNPLNNYEITWFYPHELDPEIETLIKEYFGEDQVLPKERILDFLEFIKQADEHKQILIRQEVLEAVEKAYDEQALKAVEDSFEPDFSLINTTLFPYQKRAVQFAIPKKGVIIADEMGLGKTVQAIAIAAMKKKVFEFERTLVICPASIKDQWKSEIEKFSNEKAVVVDGTPEEREEIYRESDAYFFIINYETVLRDKKAINKMSPDFIILDEAQRIKNYTTLTARSIKSLDKRHALVITGTPIENRLIDLFSIMDFIDPFFLTPLWEFSYQHCYFDQTKKNKITGYFNLQNLKDRLQPILIRREKREVIKELPNITEMDIPVDMHPDQAEYHKGFAMGVAAIIRKKFLTQFDINRLLMLLNQMRMACNSTFLIDKETNHSPKLEELKHILTEKLDLPNQDRKIIIFSEWIRMHGLIGHLLREMNLPFVELNGKVPVSKRQVLIDKFQNDPRIKVFLSTESGGAGLNLQAADTVINFELPWNPAKKNQRIGRIDRLGQTAEHLTVINLITRHSIEMKIATGLILKQNLFEGVLNESSNLDEVDFSSSGRSQFLKQIEAVIEELADPIPEAGESVDGEGLLDEIVEFTKEPEEAVPGISASDSEETIQTNEEEKPSTTQAKTSNGVPSSERAEKMAQMEQVMSQGLGFLSGIFKMATGQDLGTEEQSIEVNKETGEVVMRFKIPTL
ncbi:MAG: DEAD/DEAH box helicase [Bacteroidetes bacterium]|nr:DEAD/DEAH box helicase [Bacteroidota bacterium]